MKDKILLITGGTGSFGNTVLQRYLDTDVAEIRIFSRDEEKQDKMRHRYKSSKISYFIGDIREASSIRKAMRGVDYVFHAAALKQVPSCEFFPIEAVKTNVLGTENMLCAAEEEKVSKVVVLSTDKAVYPINAMGIAKAMMEKIMIAHARTSTTLMCGTRYGNVLASRGSVVPLFIDQIKAGKDITITNPNMTRFLMSLEEAVDLVYFAFENAKAGEIFVLKAPASTAGDLAQAVKELFKVNNEIKIIGPRPGEKIHETLLTGEELAVAEDIDKFFRVPMNREPSMLKRSPYNEEGYTSNKTERLSVEKIKERLLSLSYIKTELKEWNEKNPY